MVATVEGVEGMEALWVCEIARAIFATPTVLRGCVHAAARLKGCGLRTKHRALQSITRRARSLEHDIL